MIKKVIKSVQFVLLSLLVLFAIPVFALEPVSVEIPVSCKAKSINDSFTYTITPKEENAPIPENETITLSSGEEDVFTISFDEPNTWHYQITQNEKEDTDEIKYDKTIYNATIFVGSKEDGSLYVKTSINKKGSNDKTDQCVFVNEYTKQSTANATTNTDNTTTSNESQNQTQNMDNVQTGDRSYKIWFIPLLAIPLFLLASLKKKKQN